MIFLIDVPPVGLATQQRLINKNLHRTTEGLDLINKIRKGMNKPFAEQ